MTIPREEPITPRAGVDTKTSTSASSGGHDLGVDSFLSDVKWICEGVVEIKKAIATRDREDAARWINQRKFEAKIFALFDEVQRQIRAASGASVPPPKPATPFDARTTQRTDPPKDVFDVPTPMPRAMDAPGLASEWALDALRRAQREAMIADQRARNELAIETAKAEGEADRVRANASHDVATIAIAEKVAAEKAAEESDRRKKFWRWVAVAGPPLGVAIFELVKRLLGL